MKFTLEIDPRLEKIIDGRAKALQRAIVFTLSDSARFAKDEFIGEIKRKIDRPSPFTTRADGYGIIYAKFEDPKPWSELLIKDKQSAYLNFIIGRRDSRGIGDPGASKKHVWVPGQRPGKMVPGEYSIRPRLTAYGGIPDEYSQYLYRMTFLQHSWGISRDLGREKQAGVLRKAIYSQGGVFYGTIKGRTGFWARPKRTSPPTEAQIKVQERKLGRSLALRQRGADGRFVDTGRAEARRFSKLKKGGRDARVVNKGIPFLLLKTGPFNDGKMSTDHHKILDYDGAMERGHARSLAMFDERLRHQLAKLQ